MMKEKSLVKLAVNASILDTFADTTLVYTVPRIGVKVRNFADSS